MKQQFTFDNFSAAGKFLRQMLGIAAEFEVNNDAESMRDGMERLVAQGKLMPTYIRLYTLGLRLEYLRWAGPQSQGRRHGGQ